MYPAALKKTIICAHIATALDVLGALFLVVILAFGLVDTLKNLTAYSDDELMGGGLALTILFIAITFKFALAIFREIVIVKLQQGKRWSWIASIVLSILMLFGWRIILGIVSLVGLLEQSTMSYFKKPVTTPTPPNTL